MNEQNNSSGVNTILIVILILIVGAVAIWFVNGGLPARQTENPGLNVDVTLPENTGTDNQEAGQ